MISDKIKAELELMKRHLRIMRLLMEKPIGIVRLSQLTGLPKHQVRYSLRIMQQNNFLTPTTRGAILNEKGRNACKSFEKVKKELIKTIKDI